MPCLPKNEEIRKNEKIHKYKEKHKNDEIHKNKEILKFLKKIAMIWIFIYYAQVSNRKV